MRTTTSSTLVRRASASSARTETSHTPVRGEYDRNTDVRDQRGVLRALRLQEREGERLVRRLKDTDEAESVTSARREQKAPLRDTTVARMMDRLKDGGVVLRAREGARRAGQKSTTVTYYGTAATFLNHQEQTKVRLRIRFYLTEGAGESGSASGARRSESTKDSGHLQLKIKTPRPREVDFVDKHDLRVPDDLLCRLVSLDPKEERFGANLDAIRDDLKLRTSPRGEALNPTAKVDAVCAEIGWLARRRPEFLRPSLVVTYERTGYAIDEKSYPFLRGSRDVQYQMTIDRDIRAHFPLLPRAGGTVFAAEQYLDPSLGTSFARYPDDVSVVELKEDATVARVPGERRSELHKQLLATILEPMRREIAWGAFRDQKGKYANFHRRIVEELSPHKHESEAITLAW